ncbi:gelsolin, cytoplasmic-like isoform X2 [Culicoides brevitarsis]|uniref:gelsolin, cytoplasmic-like isoform X2 n=1 Tax=Culicoides brevitarsis TaxID=469753 RepID=UPI00307B9CC0
MVFEGAGTTEGIEIWRIEKFEPVPYPKSEYGKFYSGDSFIVLHTHPDARAWDIHFWLGAETSADEAGSAALLSVQLDDSLGGGPVQYREVQDHESPLFLSYFKNGVRYLPGGVESGFNAVTPNDAGEKRLFHVKGKKNVRVKQVKLHVSSMNKGDCFILDAGEKIFVYQGKNSKRIERIKAINAANQIRDQDRGGRPKIEIIDEFSKSWDVDNFFAELGSGSAGQVAEDDDEDDEAHENKVEREIMLFKVSDESGSLEVTPISSRPLQQSMLDTNDCFILDTGTELFAWIGKNATPDEKKHVMVRAQGFIATNNYPKWTNVRRVVEGAEPAPFKQYFASWRETNEILTPIMKKILQIEEKDFDERSLHALKKSGGRALGFMPDDGKGRCEIWRMEDFKMVPIDYATYGMFFGGDSYVIKYEYKGDRGVGYLIYYWQGKNSSIDEKAGAAMNAVRLDNELNGRAIQIRVTQGNEPRHFLRMFKGKMITFSGGKASGFKNIRDHDTYDVDGTRLFRVRATDDNDARADQMPEVAKSLASDDVFVLETPDNTYIWCGKGASDVEKTVAERIAQVVSPGTVALPLEEGSEPDKFWDALGGKGEYDTTLDPPGSPILDPRLFHCRILAGRKKLIVTEIADFTQEDLNEDDCMVLDGGDEVYVWIGKTASAEEKEQSIEMAKRYLKSDPTERSDETTPIILIHQHAEPRSFKRFFPTWDNDLWGEN